MKKFILVILFCLLPLTANAKLLFGGHPILDVHVNTLKGHFYHATELTKSERVKKEIAMTVAWIEKRHKSKKVYEVGEDKGPESKLMRGAVYFMRDIEQGKIPSLGPEILEKWYYLGIRVTAKRVGRIWVLALDAK
jgi:hypothetical protein|tara:strand:+ start:1660 stop:2067 length:408 start_codon:yes stop_codon:yes gene_type:complete